MNKKNIALIICIITTFNSIQSAQHSSFADVLFSGEDSKEGFDTQLYKQPNKRPVALSVSFAPTIGLYSKDKGLPRIRTPFSPTSKNDFSLCDVYVSKDGQMYSKIDTSGNESGTKQNQIILDFYNHPFNFYELFISDKDTSFGIQYQYATQVNIMQSPLKLTHEQIKKIKEIKETEKNIILWDGKHRYDIGRIKLVELSLLDQISRTNNIIAGIPPLTRKICELHNEKTELEQDNKRLFDENISLQEIIQSQNTVNQLPSQESKLTTSTITQENMYKTKAFYFMAGGITFVTLAALALRFFRT